MHTSPHSYDDDDDDDDDDRNEGTAAIFVHNHMCILADRNL